MKTIFKMDYKYNTHIILLVMYVQYTCNNYNTVKLLLYNVRTVT